MLSTNRVEKQRKNLKNLPPTASFFQSSVSLLHSLLYLALTSGAQGRGMGIMVTQQQFPLPLLPLFLALEWEHPWAAVLSVAQYHLIHCCPLQVAAGESAPVPNTSFPTFFSHLCVHRAIFHTIFPHCCLVFFPFLNPLSLRYHHLGCWAHPCSAVGLLELAGTSMHGSPAACSGASAPNAKACSII